MPELTELLKTPHEYFTDRNMKIGGTLKSEPADFRVEEIPIYTPSGEGEHLYLWIEKEDISAEFLLQHLAKTLQIHRNDVGVAGMKDRRAITRQWVSVPGSAEANLSKVDSDQIRVLDSNRHTNKLKTGHLRGNRFTLIVREVSPEAKADAESIRQVILSRGLPNYFGTQRFGIDGETLQTGQKLLSGELDPQKIPYQRRKFLTRLALSAVQSALFNRLLSERTKLGLSHKVQLGDVLQVVASGGPFVSDDPRTDQRRFEAREIVTTGPLFGPKMKEPAGDVYGWEFAILDQFDLSPEVFGKFKKLTPGARRPCLLWLDELNVEEVDDGLQFQFELPTGAYATIVMEEFLKSAAAAAADSR